MSPREVARIALACLWTFVPMFGVERLANYYYLAHDPTFFLISGWRLEVFILSCLVGSLAAGAFLRNFRLALVSQGISLAAVLTLVYVVCDPRVCFSTAPDGFEPARLAFFLGSVVVSASSLGASSRNAKPEHEWERSLAGVAAFAGVAWYPIVFAFAGTSLLSPFSPLGVLAVMFVLGLSAACGASKTLTWKRAMLIPIGSLLLTLAVSVGIAWAYLGSVASVMEMIAVSTFAGTLVGLWLARTQRDSKNLRSFATLGFGVSIVLVLLMTLVIIPDAVSGVMPQNTPSGGSYVMGIPDYAGAYMDAPQGHAQGVGINLSFTGTSANIIENDNYLAAGIAVHSANCCVDGIDFAYRFDVLMFHGGNETLLATAWEACDDVVACGGHSWKVLMFSQAGRLGAAGSGQIVGLRMQWQGGSVNWSYANKGAESVDFASFEAPPQENHAFNTGISGGVSLSRQKEAYFYQFGVLSKYPIESPGWGVHFQCPSILVNATWACIGHARTLTGSDSFWKVIWRWGEDYPGVNIATDGPKAVLFEYSATNATADLSPLW